MTEPVFLELFDMVSPFLTDTRARESIQAPLHQERETSRDPQLSCTLSFAPSDGKEVGGAPQQHI
jgi:hypothetical protein